MDAPLIKPDGTKQRVDITLTQEVASALGEKILAGETIFPETGPLVLTYEGGDGRITQVTLSRNTVNTWVKRDNVIPGTGQTLRAFLDEKRVEKRTRADEAEQATIKETAQTALAQIIAEPHKGGKMIKRGYKYERSAETGQMERVLKNETEVEFEGANPKLVEAKGKLLTFALERLRPDRYGAKVENTHSHFIFDLARLREAKRARDASTIEALPA